MLDRTKWGAMAREGTQKIRKLQDQDDERFGYTILRAEVR